ncbi:MAG TPA: HEAT repeat domain-containing protein [Candidatus Acidoferrales bacterium]|jgi:HEAT repeat protein|nr:HEAT repeat domain-containing protein [Candidatus Acidoferrales bacterium]
MKMRSGAVGAVVACLLMAFGAREALAQASMATPQEKAWETLEEGIQGKSTGNRSIAVRELGLLPGDAKAVELAEAALKDAKPEVRAAAAAGLGQMCSRSSVGKLEGVLDDKETAVVLAAASSLVRLKDKRGYEVYYAVLTGKRKAGKGLIAEQMKTLKDPKKMALFGFEEGLGYVPFAGMGFEAFKVITKDDASPVRAAAAKMLAKDPDPESSEALADASSDKSWKVRIAALEAIAKRGDPKLLDEVEGAMSDEKPGVRYTAAAAVIRLTTVSKEGKQEGADESGFAKESNDGDGCSETNP